MAVATDRAKPQPRRAAERDVDLVLARSPINLANLVTLGRLLMVVPLVWLIASERLEAAFWLFVAAGVSDVVDGFIAKNFNARTELGAILDPLADKACSTASTWRWRSSAGCRPGSRSWCSAATC